MVCVGGRGEGRVMMVVMSVEYGRRGGAVVFGFEEDE